jgi:type II secretory pathway pseudopilin PulG
MGNNTSPLESLAAFAIVVVVSVLSTVGFGKYIDKVKRDAKADQNQ